MMFVAMLAASDRVAMLAGMKEPGADPRQITIISAVSNMKTDVGRAKSLRFSRSWVREALRALRWKHHRCLRRMVPLLARVSTSTMPEEFATLPPEHHEVRRVPFKELRAGGRRVAMTGGTTMFQARQALWSARARKASYSVTWTGCGACAVCVRRVV